VRKPGLNPAKLPAFLVEYLACVLYLTSDLSWWWLFGPFVGILTLEALARLAGLTWEDSN